MRNLLGGHSEEMRLGAARKLQERKEDEAMAAAEELRASKQ
jgi:hypothetical protein